MTDLETLCRAADWLRQVRAAAAPAPSAASGPVGGGTAHAPVLTETRDNFEYLDHPVTGAELRGYGDALDGLVASGFKVNLRLGCFGQAIDWQLAATQRLVPASEFPAFGVTEQAELDAINRLSRLHQTVPVGLVDLLDAVDRMEGGGFEPRLRLSFSLYKPKLVEDLTPAGSNSHPSLFLFSESLARIFSEASFLDLENRENAQWGLFATDRRSHVLVLDLGSSRLDGDYLTIFGPLAVGRVYAPDEPSSLKALDAASKKLRDFRSHVGSWNAATEWLVPETFHVVRQVDNGKAIADRLESIHRELETTKVLLAAIFLASRAHSPRSDNGDARIELTIAPTGETQVISLSRKAIEPYRTYFEDFWKLYLDAFENHIGNKLDIFRRTLDRRGQDVASLFQNAGQARVAASTISDRYLGGLVDKYFDTLRRMQDYVQDVLMEAENATLDLTRTTAETTYKTVGVIAAAVVAVLLKPGISLPAVFLGSMVVAVYMAVIRCHYMPGLLASWTIRRCQFRARMREFGAFLGPEETEKLMRNPHFRRADELFRRKARVSGRLYLAMLLVAALVALYTFLLWATGIG